MNNNFKSIIAWNLNTDELLQSSSGGIFYLLGKYFINQIRIIFDEVSIKNFNIEKYFKDTFINQNRKIISYDEVISIFKGDE